MPSPFEQVPLYANPEPRCPCVLLLDVSLSMQGEKIRRLNEGLKAFQQALASDDIARKRVEVAVVTFGGRVEVVQDFVTAESFQAPALEAYGENTPMGAGIQKALDLVEERKQLYKQNALGYYRPWVFMISDGEPTESDWPLAAARVRQSETDRKVAFFAVGVGNANMTTLGMIAPEERPPLPLDGLQFTQMFLWLSKSVTAVSQSKVGEMVSLPIPAGWTKV